MIKFMATNPDTGRVVLGVGLSHENLTRLKEGRPILFKAEHLERSSITADDVMIFAGATEADMKRQLAETGVLGFMEEPPRMKRK